MTPLAELLPLRTIARRVGPWGALAIALIGLICFQNATQLEAIDRKLGEHMQAQERQVVLLKIVCIALGTTEGEKEACRQAAGDR